MRLPALRLNGWVLPWKYVWIGIVAIFAAGRSYVAMKEWWELQQLTARNVVLIRDDLSSIVREQKSLKARIVTHDNWSREVTVDVNERIEDLERGVARNQRRIMDAAATQQLIARQAARIAREKAEEDERRRFAREFDRRRP